MTNYDFIGKRRMFGTASIVLVLISLALIFTKGVNKSVDFAGGTQLTVKFADKGIDTEKIRNLMSEVDKKAGVYMNETAEGSSFTVKIKNPEVEQGKEAEASMERLHKIEKVFASINQDEKSLVESVAKLPVEAVASALAIENPLQIVGQDEEVKAAYDDLAQKVLANIDGVESISELASKVDSEKSAQVEQGIRLAFPAINRVTRDFLKATMIKFNPLGRDRSESYEDVAKQVIVYREERNDFISDMGAMLASVNLKDGEDREALASFFANHFTLGSYNITSNETFSPSIAAELLDKAWEAILLAMIGILIYISMRFTTGYAVASVVALVHDVIIALGAFSLIQAELSNPVVAAFLTIVGYSLNDTIVVFDRIRENVLSTRKSDLAIVMNDAINQTLSRTLVTSMTTLFVVIVIYLGANATLKDFAFPLLVGIIVGTYSSIFVASPVLLFWSRNVKSISSEP